MESSLAMAVIKAALLLIGSASALVAHSQSARLSRSRRATRNGERLEAIGEAEAVVSNGNERKEGPSIERSERASVDRKTIDRTSRNTGGGDEREERKSDFARIHTSRVA